MRQTTPTPLATVPPTARIAVVGANWHTEIVDGLRQGAKKAYDAAGGSLALSEFTAPGAFELPVLAASLLQEGFDGVAVLGCIIKGETIHDEVRTPHPPNIMDPCYPLALLYPKQHHMC